MVGKESAAAKGITTFTWKVANYSNLSRDKRRCRPGTSSTRGSNGMSISIRVVHHPWRERICRWLCHALST